MGLNPINVTVPLYVPAGMPPAYEIWAAPCSPDEPPFPWFCILPLGVTLNQSPPSRVMGVAGGGQRLGALHFLVIGAGVIVRGAIVVDAVAVHDSVEY